MQALSGILQYINMYGLVTYLYVCKPYYDNFIVFITIMLHILDNVKRLAILLIPFYIVFHFYKILKGI